MVGRQNADIADTLHMATIFWLSVYGVHIGSTWRIQLNCPCVVAMLPFVKVL